jgi:hypothetical protein
MEGVAMNVFERYRRDIDVAKRRLASLEWRSVDTAFGRIEYLDEGDGPVVLVIHGITQAAVPSPSRSSTFASPIRKATSFRSTRMRRIFATTLRTVWSGARSERSRPRRKACTR